MPRTRPAGDDPDHTAHIARQLRREGHHVVIVAGGADALDAVRRESPDLVLLLGQPDAAGQSLSFGELEIDLGRFEVRVGGEPAGLTVTEYDLLEMLATSPGQVFSREQIIERVGTAGGSALARTVDVHVKNLRRKLGDDSAAPRWVQTVYGRGYRFAV